ncbi:MAG: histidine kinase [Bacteroidetes bacterium]|nr:histidine kinase [Bacteroidota bacterium]
MTNTYQSTFFVFFCLASFFFYPSYGQTLRFEQLTAKDGLPAAECYNVIQDKQGYIWVFSEYGIVKHNGSNFYPVCTNLEPKEQTAYAVFQSPGGELYFANSLCKIYTIKNDSAFSIKAIESFSPTFNKMNDPILQLAIDSSGNIFFSTINQNYKYTALTNEISELTLEDSVHDFVFSALTDTYFFSSRPDLCQYGLVNAKIRDHDKTIFSKVVFDTYYDRRTMRKMNNFYLLSTNQKIYRIAPDGSNISAELNDIVTFETDDNNLIWVLTTQGLVVMNSDLNVLATYLGSRTISDICFDNKGGIWVSTIGEGIYYCKDKRFISYENSVPREEIFFIKNDGKTIYTCDSKGGCYVINKGKPELIHSFTRQLFCEDISRYKNGYLIGTKKGVFHKPDNGPVSEIKGPLEGSLYSNTFWIINDREFISLGASSAVHFKDDRVASYVYMNSKYCCSVPKDEDECLLGTTYGIYVYNYKKNTIVPCLPFFADRFILKLAYDQTGNLWVSTSGNELFIVTPRQEIMCYSYLPSVTVKDIDFFGTDGIIFSTNKGVYYNHSTKKTRAEDWQLLFDHEVNAVETDSATIWIASKSGLYSKAIQHLNQNQTYPVFIDAVYANSQLLPSDFSELAHSENDLRFNLHFLNYQSQVQRFWYTLAGPTESSGIINGNVLQIQNLSPGSYELGVFPFNGLSTKEDTFVSKSFIIHPAFWQTYWFRILVILAIAIISGALVRFYYHLKRKRERRQTEFDNRVATYKLMALKAQINPHFISNSLAAIQLMIDSGNADRANLYIAKFGLLIRYILKYSDRSVARLSDELKIIDLNIELEQLRFPTNFLFIKQISDDIDLADTYVPPLITQPFIENAIWHGLVPLKSERNPKLILTITKENDFIVISIIDNGLGRVKAADRKPIHVNEHKVSKGTQIIQDRIDSINQFYTNTAAEVTTIDLYDDFMNPVGTQVNLKLPVSLPDKLEKEYDESNSYR